MEGATTDKEKAIKAFYAVRDCIRYDPYRITDRADAYKASDVLEIGAAYCIPKASLLTAVTRAAGIPTAIGLSDVTNHMCTDRMRNAMGGKDLFMHHGYAVMLIEGKWVKAAPAFNIELCDKFDVTPTEFDGVEDALLQEFDKKAANICNTLLPTVSGRTCPSSGYMTILRILRTGTMEAMPRSGRPERTPTGNQFRGRKTCHLIPDTCGTADWALSQFCNRRLLGKIDVDAHPVPPIS